MVNAMKKALLMLSGGRDSFLSACELIKDGYQVYLVTYNNGHMAQTENVKALSDRLEKVFGNDRIKQAGIYLIAQNIRPLLEKALNSEPSELCKDYPHLLLGQLNCLVCHTVMYFHSIAYCKAREIDTIAEGAREEQKFFVELPEMKKRYERLCEKYGLMLRMPVYDLKSDARRKEMLGEWNFNPKSYEPQCWVGCPMLKELTSEQRSCLANYYDYEIEPHAESVIQRLIGSKRILSDCDLAGEYV